MSIIATPSPQDVTGLAAEIYADDAEHMGHVPDHTRVMAVNPEAYLAWENLIGAIAGGMDKRRYELITLAAAAGARSEHCLLAHGTRTLKYIPEAELIGIAVDFRTADVTPAEVAMMEFAERVSRDSHAMTDADSLRLREHGFTDREIVDIALAAAARNYFSRAIQALAVPVDVPAGLSPELRAALTSGLADRRVEPLTVDQLD